MILSHSAYNCFLLREVKGTPQAVPRDQVLEQGVRAGDRFGPRAEVRLGRSFRRRRRIPTGPRNPVPPPCSGDLWSSGEFESMMVALGYEHLMTDQDAKKSVYVRREEGRIVVLLLI